ncbi:DUF488 domain-containing protein [Thermodesulforhabdus norvegica]|uniref:Uncharacterized conserved protein YeaO, DUF488 family n=1 Tax=Thermodesulforhabdus norvegica TaxID=39841 RepID=A0A1I4SDP0_9BACT|nr:DUF488 family protein [Thermodesulforhabdus norvegica]SFM62582.1 Uncharacterized conserved protein YeaO, DUF488 family [Thermodesulforhabdus norvegica]
MAVMIKNIHAEPHEDDGKRFLIETGIPPGLTREQLVIYGWFKELAPPEGMKALLDGREETWRTFRREYYQFLLEPAREPLLRELTEKARFEQITLVYDAVDDYRNHATVLKTLIELRMRMDDEY